MEEHNDDDFEMNSWFEVEYLCNCMSQKNCSLPINQARTLNSNSNTHNWRQSDTCLAERDRRYNLRNSANADTNPQANFMIVAKCTTLSIENPITGKFISKEELGMMVVFVDMVVVVVFLIFLEVAENGQKDYVEQFKDETIEMDDFSLRVKNLPKDSYYGGEPDHLKAYLHEHFEAIVKD